MSKDWENKAVAARWLKEFWSNHKVRTMEFQVVKC